MLQREQHDIWYHAFVSTKIFFFLLKNKLLEPSQNSLAAFCCYHNVCEAFGLQDFVFHQLSTPSRRPKISIFSCKKYEREKKKKRGRREENQITKKGG